MSFVNREKAKDKRKNRATMGKNKGTHEAVCPSARYADSLLYICLHLIIYMPMNFDIIPMIFEPKCPCSSKGLLWACKRVRFTLQKESFYTAKGLHLEGKRSPFEKAGENCLNA